MEEMNLMNCVVILYQRECGEVIIPFNHIRRIIEYNNHFDISVFIETDDCKIGGTHYEILTIEELKKRNKQTRIEP